MIFKKMPAKEKERFTLHGVEVVIIPSLCGNCISYNQNTGAVLVYAKDKTADLETLVEKAKRLKTETQE